MDKLNWLRTGERVVAIDTIIDVEAGSTEPTAVPGDYGTVEHTEDGWLPTVRFDRTQCAYGVTDKQVRRAADDG